ncbi:hypothetical protein, partial [Micromonospora sp. NPDC005206]|uniref:hypothetical protein n=1 Tax=Micromonospora sp. NPDC005206 TaxID=3157022 RepID=UPI0033A198E8
PHEKFTGDDPAIGGDLLGCPGDVTVPARRVFPAVGGYGGRNRGGLAGVPGGLRLPGPAVICQV